jgi:hypothetical protein
MSGVANSIFQTAHARVGGSAETGQNVRPFDCGLASLFVRSLPNRCLKAASVGEANGRHNFPSPGQWKNVKISQVMPLRVHSPKMTCRKSATFETIE